MLLTTLLTLLPASVAPGDSGWTTLFDGEAVHGLRAFRGEEFPTQGWVVEEGALRHLPNGGGGDLVTNEVFRDFVLEFEWKVTEGANSGVMYRVGEEFDRTYFTGPEYQVLDDAAHVDAGPKVMSGALYGLHAAEGAVARPVGEWNTGRIVVIGERIEHYLNGVRVVQAELASEDWKARVEGSKFKQWPAFGTLPEGRIAFQDHGGDVSYRGIRVLDLGSSRKVGLEVIEEGLPGWEPPLEEEDLDAFEFMGEWIWREGSLHATGSTVSSRLRSLTGAGTHARLEYRGGPPSVVQHAFGATGGLVQALPTRSNWGLQVLRGEVKGHLTRSIPDVGEGPWHCLEMTVWGGHAVLRVDGTLVAQAWFAPWEPRMLSLTAPREAVDIRSLTLRELPEAPKAGASK